MRVPRDRRRGRIATAPPARQAAALPSPQPFSIAGAAEELSGSMKRIVWTLAAAGAAAVALFMLVFALLPRDTLKTRIGEQIAAWTGRDVSLSGEPDIDFFPRLT